MTSEDDIRRFMLLHRANTRSFGNWDPTTRNTHTEKREIKFEDFKGHFDGSMGIGCVPLRDDDTCYWGGIDIDNHGKTEDSDIKGIEKAVNDAGYPLVATRSKSGGVHLYLYLSEPTRAELVRRVLKMWADALKIPGTDCLFPKHDRMNRDSDTGEKGLSNWLNFSYFGTNLKGGTDRYAVVNGKKISFQHYLDHAESMRQSGADIQKWANFDHTEAPPCLIAKFKSGFTPGERNTGVYQITVYARKKDGGLDQAAESAHELAEMYIPDMKYGERQKTVKSALTKAYNYKCEEFADVCDKELCKKRKYGVSESQYRDMKTKELIPRFFEAIMWTGTDTPKWSVKAEVAEGVDPYEIKYLDTDELRKYDLFRRRMIEMTPIYLPTLKQAEWDQLIGPVMAGKIIAPMPEDITEIGMIKGRLRDFLAKADWDADSSDTRTRQPLMRGLPVVIVHKGIDVAMFRAQDFDKYLRDVKVGPFKNMWLKMTDVLEAGSDRMRVGPNHVTAWYVPAEPYRPGTNDPVDLTPEY